MQADMLRTEFEAMSISSKTKSSGRKVSRATGSSLFLLDHHITMSARLISSCKKRTTETNDVFQKRQNDALKELSGSKADDMEKVTLVKYTKVKYTKVKYTKVKYSKSTLH